MEVYPVISIVHLEAEPGEQSSLQPPARHASASDSRVSITHEGGSAGCQKCYPEPDKTGQDTGSVQAGTEGPKRGQRGTVYEVCVHAN